MDEHNEMRTFSTMKLVSKDSPEPYLNKGSLLLITDKIERNKQAINEYIDDAKEQIEIKKLEIKVDGTNSRPLNDIIEPGEEEVMVVNTGFAKEDDKGFVDPSRNDYEDKHENFEESYSFSKMRWINK